MCFAGLQLCIVSLSQVNRYLLRHRSVCVVSVLQVIRIGGPSSPQVCIVSLSQLNRYLLGHRSACVVFVLQVIRIGRPSSPVSSPETCSDANYAAENFRM